MRVVVGRQVGLVLVVAAVALLAELAVEGLQGLAGGGGLRWGKGLVSLSGGWVSLWVGRGAGRSVQGLTGGILGACCCL